MMRPVLPPCSVRDCPNVAGAIINGVLLCGQHAVEELERRKLVPRDDAGDKSVEP